MVQTVFIFVCLSSLVFVSYVASKTKKPIRTIFKHVLSGVCALSAVNLLATYTGFGIALNFYTACITVTLGAPGVITMLMLRYILFM